MTDAPITEDPQRLAQRVSWTCTRCGYEAKEFEPMLPAGWLIVTTAHASADQSMGTLCGACSNELYEWLLPKPHEHDMIDATEMGAGFTRKVCGGCPFQIITLEGEEISFAQVDRLARLFKNRGNDGD